MKKTRLILAVLLFWACATAQAQNGNANFGMQWVLGSGATYKVDFKSGVAVTSMYDSVDGVYMGKGHSSICDNEGNMILCSDGMTLYNSVCDTLDGGDTLVESVDYVSVNGAGSNLAQSSIFLPFQNGKYYLVNQTITDSLCLLSGTSFSDKLQYHVVDMNANGGAGKVVRKKVQMVVPGTKLSTVQMTACRHANGEDWWLVKQGFDSNVVYTFLFQQDTVLGPFIQRFPAPMFSNLNHNGQSAFSLDGTRYATTCRGAKNIFVADFDRCTGIFSNPLVYGVPVASTNDPNVPTATEQWSESCQFSPSGRFLYVAQYYNVQQLDLQDNNVATQWVHAAGLDTTFNDFMKYSTIYSGADGRLYVGNWNELSGQMSYFATPDVKGAGCGFTPRGLRFPVIYNAQGQPWRGVSDPPNMPNYALGATNPPCGGLGVEEVVVSPQIQVYPNPGSDVFKITLTGGNVLEGNLEVTNLLGQRIVSVPLAGSITEVNLKGQPAGLYYYRWLRNGKTMESGKIVLIP